MEEKDVHRQLLRLIDDTLRFIYDRLKGIEELREKLESEEQTKIASVDEFVWGTIDPDSFVESHSQPSLVIGIGNEIESSAVELICGPGLRAMVDAVNRFAANLDKHNGIISVQYIGPQTGGYHTCLVHYCKKDEDDA